MGDQGRGFAGNGRWRGAIPGRILARMPRAAQPAARRARLHAPPAPHEYAFLVGPLIDAATLRRAEAEALDCGVATHEVLLAAGWVSQDDYAAALARKLGVPVVAWDAELDPADAAHGRAAEIGLPAWRHGRACRVLAATAATPDGLLGHVCRAAGARHRRRPRTPALHRCGAGGAPSAGADRSGRPRPPRGPAGELRPDARRDLADAGGRRPGRAHHRRLRRGPRCNLRRADGADRHPIPVRHAAAAGGSAPGGGRPAAPRAPGVAAIPGLPRLAAAGLHRAGAARARGQRAAGPRAIAARARLSRRQARDLSGAGGCTTPRRRRPCWRWSCPATSAPWWCRTERRTPSPRP